MNGTPDGNDVTGPSTTLPVMQPDDGVAARHIPVIVSDRSQKQRPNNMNFAGAVVNGVNLAQQHQGGAAAEGSGGSPAPSPSGHLPPPPHGGGGTADRNRRNKTKNYNSRFIRGTGNAPSNWSSLAPAKPGFLKHKVLVIHGLDKNVDSVRLQQELDIRAGHPVELLYVAPLSREKSWCKTIAIELNDSDYDQLSKPDFWEKGIKIRPWHGFKPWRQATRPTREEVQSSMREQWR